MADLTPEPPPEPPDTPTAGAGERVRAGGSAPGCWAFVEVATGVVVGLVLSIAGTALVYTAVNPANACGAGVGTAIVGFVILAVVGALAWLAVFRLRAQRPGVGLLRGIVVTAFLYLAVPWPCSTAWLGVYAAASACGHR